MTINEKIKQYLEEHGIKQAFLVEKTGISHYTISNMLNGKRDIKANELRMISKTLGVDPNIFLD